MKDLSGTLPKALIILKFMASRQDAVSFQQIKNHSRLSSNVLSRILKTYLEWGFFTKDTETGLYSLGSESFNLAKTILQENLLQDIASIAVKDLAGLTGESAAFFEYDGKEIKLIAKSEVANSYHYLKLLSSDVHSPNNAFIYSILPFIPTQESDSFFAKNELVFNFDESLVKDDFDAIREEKSFIRKERYERADITRICVPVFCKEQIVGSVGVTINSHNIHREDMEQILQHCLATARSIESKL